MKIYWLFAVWLILFVLLTASRGFAQPTPPAPPSGQMLDAWAFETTNWTSFFHETPLAFTNLTLYPDWAGNGLLLDTTNPAFLNYAVLTAEGWTNLALTNGTLTVWFSPDWNTADGPGNWGTLLEVGTWQTNLADATGAWGLYFSPDGASLFFSAQTNGSWTNYLAAPINWYAGDWHQITLAYSLTNTALYLEGAFVTNGPGISVGPSATIISNGFSVGSDGFDTALLQARGMFNDLVTYDYVLDAATVSNYYADEAQNVFPLPASGGGFSGDYSPPSPGGGGSYTNDGGGPVGSYNDPAYGSNQFWIEIVPFGTNSNSSTSNYLSLILHNTQADTAYEIESTTNLQEYNTWKVEETIIGSETTNFTPFVVSMIGRSNLFLRAFNGTLDTDGDGLPDFWEIKYSTSGFPLSATNADTGNTGIPDGYKLDSAGDGYNNLQKYQMGVPPGTWVTPPTPTGLSATLGTNGTTARLAWNASPGSVTSYTILVSVGGSSFSALTNVSGSLTSFTNTSSSFTNGVQFEIRANYAGGSSGVSASTDPTLQPNLTTDARVVRGPQGAPYLVVSAMPSGVTAYRVYMGGDGSYYENMVYPIIEPDNYAAVIDPVSLTSSNNYFDVPVALLTNGIYPIPAGQIPLYAGEHFRVQALGANGQNGKIVDEGYNGVFRGGPNPSIFLGNLSANIPFLDGRTSIAQNINFRLQSGQLDYAPHPVVAPFAFADPGISAPDYTQTNYVSCGFHFYCPSFDNSPSGNGVGLDELEPFEENAVYYQFCFETNLLSGGSLTPDVYYPGPDCVCGFPFDSAGFVTAGSTNAPAGPVTASAAQWIYYEFYVDQEIGFIEDLYGDYTLGTNICNVYGLPFLSARWQGPDEPPAFPIVLPGDTISSDYFTGSYFFFSGVPAPALQTVGYYFARPSVDVFPGGEGFNITNTTPAQIMASFGQYFVINGWAKQAITNGYPDKFAYPEQYFDQAYLADTSGNITTNQTGILSEYGEFFPTQPGKVFLTTLPDGATGTTGQVAVNFAKLQLDANGDGTMDTSYGGPDNPSADRPFRLWINDDCDEPGVNGYPDRDLDATNLHDCALMNTTYGQHYIHSQRDLEDYARLWICGVPALTNGGYQVTLSWTNIVNGNPSIILFQSVETNGGTGYLTDTNIAASQSAVFVGSGDEASPGPGMSIGMVSNTFTFPTNFFTNGLTKYLLFEGASVGNGQLVMTITQNGTNLASTSTFINLMEVSDMFEHAHITGITTNLPGNSFSATGYAEDNPLPVDPTEDTNLVLFIHGWRMGAWDYENFSETMFKRLYWQGFRGRFLSLRWPTFSQDDFWLPAEDYTTYNSSEFIAWKSGSGLSAYLTHLKARFPNNNLNVCAHSMGNVVMAEALKEQLALGQQNVHNYVLMQAAVPASCYDTSFTNYTQFITAEASQPTPNTYRGYPGSINDAISGQMVDFYNTNDYALATGTLDILGVNVAINWEANQENFKPDSPLNYRVDSTGTNCANGFVNITNNYEIMAFCARPRSKAVGAQPSVNGVIHGAGVDLTANFGFSRASDEHSAQFNWTIQQTWDFYGLLFDDLTAP